MMVYGLDWLNIGAIFTMMTVVSGIGLLVLRTQMARFFPTRREHDNLADRIEALQTRLATMPGHEDLKAIMSRLADGQGRFETLAARMDGIGMAIGRVENQVDMLVRAMLDREKTS